MNELPESQEKRGDVRGDGPADGARPAHVAALADSASFHPDARRRRRAGPRVPAFQWQSLTILAAAVATVVFAYVVNRLVVRATHESPAHEAIGKGLRELLDSAGPAVVAMNLDGRAVLLQSLGGTVAGLPRRGAGAIVGQDRNPGAGRERAAGSGDPEALPRDPAAGANACRAHGRVPGLRTHAAAQHGAQLHVRRCATKTAPSSRLHLHVSALRDATAELTGMVAVAVEQGSIPQREQAQRESQERYRDLFEHSSEMIATLSPTRPVSLCESRMAAVLWAGAHGDAGLAFV